MSLVVCWQLLSGMERNTFPVKGVERNSIRINFIIVFTQILAHIVTGFLAPSTSFVSLTTHVARIGNSFP